MQREEEKRQTEKRGERQKETSFAYEQMRV